MDYFYRLACLTCDGDLEARKVYIPGCLGSSAKWTSVCPKCKPDSPQCHGCPPLEQCSQCQRHSQRPEDEQDQ